MKFGFFLIFTSSSAFSYQPLQGLYFGLLGQLSHAPNTQLDFTIDQSQYTGQVTLGPVGGGVGFSLGYKMNNFRLEGEFLFNMNNYGELQVGSCTLISPTVLGPQGTCPAYIVNNGLGFNGNTIGYYGLFNGYYDFISSNPDIAFVPYLGLGLGGALISNRGNIESNEYSGISPQITFDSTSSNFGFALQGIVGFHYFLDDFTTLGLDFRYVSALNSNNNKNNSNNSTNSQFGISTINLVFTFAFSKDTN